MQIASLSTIAWKPPLENRLHGPGFTLPAVQLKDTAHFSRQPSLRFGYDAATLAGLFPKASEIPKAVAIPNYHGSRFSLINGELKRWYGSMDQILSVVPTRKGRGKAAQLVPKVIGQLPLMGKAEALAAVQAAEAAYDMGTGLWPSMSPQERSEAVRRFVGEMKKERDMAVRLLMYETGKSLKDSQSEFDRTVEYIEKTLVAYDKLMSGTNTILETGGLFYKKTYTPQGVILCMGPSNYPLNETFTTLIPALVTGNTIVCKLPRMGALLMTTLYPAFQKSFPKGAVNFVSGDGPTVVNPIMESGKVSHFAFIGSNGAGDKIIRLHPKPTELKYTLGLGAKNPAILLPGLTDAELESAAQQCLKGSLSNNGERCTAFKALFVHEEIADKFKAAFLRAVNQNMKVAMPYQTFTDKATLHITPRPGNFDFFKGLIEDAVGKGAEIINPGGGTQYGSLFVPAILDKVTPEMNIYKQEQFGPVVPIIRYQSFDEIDRFLRAIYPLGQQASIFANPQKDKAQVQQLVTRLSTAKCRTNLDEECRRSPDEVDFDGRAASAQGALSVDLALTRFTQSHLLGKTGGNNPANAQTVLGQYQLS